jgi:hypothetical protein
MRSQLTQENLLPDLASPSKRVKFDNVLKAQQTLSEKDPQIKAFCMFPPSIPGSFNLIFSLSLSQEQGFAGVSVLRKAGSNTSGPYQLA